MKPSDLVKITESPQAEKRSKSYYLGVKPKKHHEVDKSYNNFNNTSINAEKRKKSKTKLKNKSLTHNNNTQNNTITEKMNKSFK